MESLFSDHDLDKAFVKYGINRPQKNAVLISDKSGYSATPEAKFINPFKVRAIETQAVEHFCDCGKCADCEALYYELLHKRL